MHIAGTCDASDGNTVNQDSSQVIELLIHQMWYLSKYCCDSLFFWWRFSGDVVLIIYRVPKEHSLGFGYVMNQTYRQHLSKYVNQDVGLLRIDNGGLEYMYP